MGHKGNKKVGGYALAHARASASYGAWVII